MPTCPALAGPVTYGRLLLITLAVDCPPSIAGGLIWNGQRVASTSLQRCSNLHENFHSGVFISRVCTIRGQWEDVDFSSCTMQLYSDPVIVAQGQVLSNNESYIDEFRDEVMYVSMLSSFIVSCFTCM